MTEFAKLELGGKTYEFPILEGTEGERAIDIGRLREQTGLITLDPAFKNTGSCASAVTFIDGERGILRHRGYSIEELTEKSTFLEVSYLLLYGELPTKLELESWLKEIRYHTMLHEDLKRLYEGFPKAAHAMAVCSAIVSALSTFYPMDLDPADEEQVRLSTTRLIAKLPTITAYSYKHLMGQPFLYPDNDLSYVGNFMQMMFATPCESYEVDPVVEKTLDLLLILHADHGQNCSTSTVRLVGSSRANIFASISAAINALWGPRHGGANQDVIRMLWAIEKEGLTAKEFVDRAKSRDDTSRLMGFGHRVYKNYDPRALIIKSHAHDVLRSLRRPSKLLEIAMDLERIALEDDYFIERKLFPNVDFYSGVIFEALEIPMNLFTAMFSMGRLPGWIAQWSEYHTEPGNAIGRPRQLYTGVTQRPYVSLDQR